VNSLKHPPLLRTTVTNHISHDEFSLEVTQHPPSPRAIRSHLRPPHPIRHPQVRQHAHRQRRVHQVQVQNSFTHNAKTNKSKLPSPRARGSYKYHTASVTIAPIKLCGFFESSAPCTHLNRIYVKNTCLNGCYFEVSRSIVRYVTQNVTLDAGSH
jgi:hypothetical protein